MNVRKKQLYSVGFNWSKPKELPKLTIGDGEAER